MSEMYAMRHKGMEVDSGVSPEPFLAVYPLSGRGRTMILTTKGNTSVTNRISQTGGNEGG